MSSSTISHELLAAHTFRFSPLGSSKKVALSPAQQDIVAEFLRPTSKDLQVIAGAGAGKTATLVESVSQVLEAKQYTEREVLLVSFSRNARTSLQAKLKGAMNDTKNTIHTFSSLALALTGRATTDCADLPEARVPTWYLMQQAEKKAGGVSLTWEASFHSGSEEEDEATSSKLVIELSRLQSKGHLVSDPDFEEHVIDPSVRTILKNFDALLKEKGEFTFGQNAIEALRILRQRPVSSTYKLVIVDEAQDNDSVQLEIAELLAANGRLVLVGDPRQCIHRWRGAEPDFFIDFCKRATTKVMDLTENYRSHDEIVVFGNAVASHMERSSSVTKAMTSHSANSALFHAGYRQVAPRIVKQLKVAPLQHDQIAVLARTWFPLWNVYRALLTAGVRVSFKKHKGWLRSNLEQLRDVWSLTKLGEALELRQRHKFMYDMAAAYLRANPQSSFEDYLDVVPICPAKGGRTDPKGGPPTVRLSTIQSVKGEEFDQVWLLDAGVQPRLTGFETKEEVAALFEDELRIYYTGVTRAKQRLIVVNGVPDAQYKTLQPSNFFPALQNLFASRPADDQRDVPRF